MEEDEVISESPEVDTTAELDALVESEATLSDEFKEAKPQLSLKVCEDKSLRRD